MDVIGAVLGVVVFDQQARTAHRVVVPPPALDRAGPGEARLRETVGDYLALFVVGQIIGRATEVMADQRFEPGLRVARHVGIRETARDSTPIGTRGVRRQDLRRRDGIHDRDSPSILGETRDEFAGQSLLPRERPFAGPWPGWVDRR